MDSDQYVVNLSTWVLVGRVTLPVAAARVRERARHHLRTRRVSINGASNVDTSGIKCGYVWHQMWIRLVLDVDTSGTECGFV